MFLQQTILYPSLSFLFSLVVEICTSVDGETARAAGRFLALTLNLLFEGAAAKSDLSCAAFFTNDEVLDVLVTFLSEEILSDVLAEVGRLILLLSINQLR